MAKDEKYDPKEEINKRKKVDSYEDASRKKRAKENAAEYKKNQSFIEEEASKKKKDSAEEKKRNEERFKKAEEQHGKNTDRLDELDVKRRKSGALEGKELREFYQLKQSVARGDKKFADAKEAQNRAQYEEEKKQTARKKSYWNKIL